MRDAIVERESWPVKAMTRASASSMSGAPPTTNIAAMPVALPARASRQADHPRLSARQTELKLLDDLTDEEIAAKLPVHLRHLPVRACGVRGRRCSHFPILAVRKVIDRGIADAAANGGFRNPYYGTRPGEGEKPGLWLVGDEGVYIMSNGKLAEGRARSSSMPSSAIPRAIPTGGTTSAATSAR
jgi:hypothetical protein